MIVRYRGLGVFAPAVYVGTFLLLRKPLQTEGSWLTFLVSVGIAGAITFFLGRWLNGRSERHTLFDVPFEFWGPGALYLSIVARLLVGTERALSGMEVFLAIVTLPIGALVVWVYLEARRERRQKGLNKAEEPRPVAGEPPPWRETRRP